MWLLYNDTFEWIKENKKQKFVILFFYISTQEML